MGTSINISAPAVSPGQATGLLAKTLSVPLNPTVAYIRYSAASGPFEVGEAVFGTLGGVATLVNDTGFGLLELSPVTNSAFTVGDTINGANSGATATIESFSYTDTTITLSGGNEYQIVNVTITNPSSAVLVAEDAEIWTSEYRRGNQLFVSNPFSQENLRILVNAENYIDTLSGTFPHTQCWPPPCAGQVILSGNQLYFSIATAESIPVSVDIYVYGNIIA